MARTVDHQMIGAAGEFLTAGKLFKRGYQVSLTLSNAKAIDLFVYNPETKRKFCVQVKTQHRKNGFPLKRENIVSEDIYVFVRLNEADTDEEFFVLAGQEILSRIDHFFGSSYTRPDKPSSMPCINYGPLELFRSKWGIFDEPEQSEA